MKNTNGTRHLLCSTSHLFFLDGTELVMAGVISGKKGDDPGPNVCRNGDNFWESTSKRSRVKLFLNLKSCQGFDVGG